MFKTLFPFPLFNFSWINRFTQVASAKCKREKNGKKIVYPSSIGREQGKKKKDLCDNKEKCQGHDNNMEYNKFH